MSNNFIRTEVLLCEFAGRTCCAEELSFDESLVSDLKVRRWSSSSVRGSLVTELGSFDIILEKFLEFTEGGDKLLSASRSEVALQMNGDVGMITFVGKEWSDLGGRAGCVIVSKLRES